MKSTPGKVLVAGNFTDINDSYAAHKMVMLTPTGAHDKSFRPSFDWDTWAVERQVDGKLLVGGNFYKVNGVSDSFMTRLNSDGTRDTSFSCEPNDRVYDICVLPDGKIYICGNFTSVNGVIRYGMAKLNSDGSLDTAFNLTGTGFNTGFKCGSMLPLASGKVICVGDFTSYNGVATTGGVVRLNSDGTLDATFTNGGVPSTWVLGIRADKVDPTKFWIWGWVPSYFATTTGQIVRVNADGTIDATFSFAAGFGPGNVVWSMDQFADGKVVIGVGNATYNTKHIYKLNYDGTVDTTFDTNVGTGFTRTAENHTIPSNPDAPFLQVRLDANEKIICMGYFSAFNGTPARYIIRLNANGTKDNTFESVTGLDGATAANWDDGFGSRKILFLPNNNILLTGNFRTYNSKLPRIGVLNPDGTQDLSFNVGLGFNGGPVKRAIRSADKLNIWAVGDFTSFNGITKKSVVKLKMDGTVDSSFDADTGFNSITRFGPLFDKNGKMLFGGQFTSYRGTTKNYVARLNPDGTIDTSFDVGTLFTSLTAQAYIDNVNEKIYVSGHRQGTGTACVLRLNWDGSLDATWPYWDGSVTAAAGGLAWPPVLLEVIASDKLLMVINGYQITNVPVRFLGMVVTISTGAVDPAYFNNAVEPNGAPTDAWYDKSTNKVYLPGVDTYDIDRAHINKVDINGNIVSMDVKGINNEVHHAIENIAGNRYYIVGGFTSYRKTTVGYLVRTQLNGDVDTSFVTGTGFNDQAWVIRERSDGKVYVAGRFTQYNHSKTVNQIAKLNPDGTLDTAFKASYGTLGFNAKPSVVVQDPSTGKVYVAGSFTTYQNVACKQVVRLNTDGSIDNTFAPLAFTATTYGWGIIYISALAIATDGKVYVGGYFDSYGGVSAINLVRLNTDGTRDATFSVGTGFTAGATGLGRVTFIKIDGGGKLYVGGGFTQWQGVSQNRLIRLNTDGTKDIAFNIGTGFNQNDNIYMGSHPTGMDIDSLGKLWICGGFSSYGSTTNNCWRAIKLNTDGTRDMSFNTGTTLATSFDGITYTVCVDPNDKVYFGGQFKNFNGAAAQYWIRFNNNGTHDTGFNSALGQLGADNFVYKLKKIGSHIYATGSFTSIAGIASYGIARVNASAGTFDATYSSKALFIDQPTDIIESLDVCGDGDIFIIGSFTGTSESMCKRIVRLNSNGTVDLTFNMGAGFNDRVYDIIEEPATGKLFVTGEFTMYNGQIANRIAKLNPDGTMDSTFNTGTGFNDYAEGMLLDSGGKLYVAGAFTTYKGVTQNGLIRINPDGSKDSVFNIGTGFGWGANGIQFLPDGKLIVANGNSDIYNGVPFGPGLIKLNLDGSVDTSFNGGDGTWGGSPTSGIDNSVSVRTLQVQADGKIILGGYFSSYKGQPVGMIMRVNQDGSLDTTFTNGKNYDPNGSIYFCTPITGGYLIGGYCGFFTPQPANAARVNIDGSRDKGFNPVFNDYTTRMYRGRDRVYATGNFATNGKKSTAVIAAMRTDGSPDPLFVMTIGANSSVETIVPLD